MDPDNTALRERAQEIGERRPANRKHRSLVWDLTCFRYRSPAGGQHRRTYNNWTREGNESVLSSQLQIASTVIRTAGSQRPRSVHGNAQAKGQLLKTQRWAQALSRTTATAARLEWCPTKPARPFDCLKMGQRQTSKPKVEANNDIC